VRCGQAHDVHRALGAYTCPLFNST
jgi:hypothetical protein